MAGHVGRGDLTPLFEPGTALLIVDMLNDFVREGAPLRVPEAEKTIPVIQCVRAMAHSAGAPVIYLCDSHRPDDPEFRAWGPHALRGTKGAEVIVELTPRPDDIVIRK